MNELQIIRRIQVTLSVNYTSAEIIKEMLSSIRFKFKKVAVKSIKYFTEQATLIQEIGL